MKDERLQVKGGKIKFMNMTENINIMNIVNLVNWLKNQVYLTLIKQWKIVFKNIINFKKIKNLFSFFLILTSLTLSGCVQYDLGINFNHTNNGELVQNIKIPETVISFSGDYVDQWLNSLERRVKKLSGSVKRSSPEGIIVKIPFTNGKELQEKFSFFFKDGASQKSGTIERNELSNIVSNLILEDNNFLLISRNHLIYDLDLNALAALKANNVKATDSIIDLDFNLQTPWGVNNIQQSENILPAQKKGKQLVWKLKPGELNHIEVVFWTPNFLGIGTLIIILLMWGGYYLKYKLLVSR